MAKYSDDEKFDKVFFAKIDADILSELCDELDVQAMPTLIILKKGKRENTAVDPNYTALAALIESSLR